jgi:hypothetical protein
VIGKSISLLNRQKRKALNKRLRKLGLQISRVQPEAVRAHAITLTNYLRNADPQLARKLGLTDEPSHSTLKYIADVAGTLDEVTAVESAEKVDVVGFCNLPSDNFDRNQIAMVATMMQSPGGDDPLEHYMLSWQSHEQPTPQQLQCAVEIFLEVMDLAEHQAIYASHKNTENYHVHIAVNRVHPESFKRTAAGGDWQIDTIHQAIAMIEYEQGWARQAGAIYVADNEGVRHVASNLRVRDGNGPTGKFPSKGQRADEREAKAARKEARPIEDQLSAGAQSYERRTGHESFERICLTVAQPIVLSARSWPELHKRLANEGLAYELGGTGARIRCGKQTLSATTAHRRAALKQIEARVGFGTFEPNPGFVVQHRVAQALGNPMSVERYEIERAAYVSRVNALRQQIAGRRRQIVTAMRGQRQAISALVNRRIWKGRNDMLAVAQALVTAQTQQVSDLAAALGQQLTTSLAGIPNFPSYNAWTNGAVSPALPDIADMALPSMLMPPAGFSEPAQIDIEGFRREAGNSQSRYFDHNGHLAFRDVGSLIIIAATRDKEAVRAAMLLARHKWSVVGSITGNDRFKDLCAAIAAEEGMELSDPDMVQRLARAEKNIRQSADKHVGLSPSDQQPVGSERIEEALPTSDADVSEFGQNPLIEEWIVAHCKDPTNFGMTRSIAARIIRDADARALLTEMIAQGIPEATKIQQQARFNRQVMQAQQTGWQR